MNEDLKDIIDLFEIEGRVEEVKPLGDGLINDTYLVVTSDDASDYVLQRINHNVFKDIEGMMRNIECVTFHIRSKLKASGENDIERKVLEFIKIKNTFNKEGSDDYRKSQQGRKYYYYDGESYWRLSRFITGTETLQDVTPETAHDAGKAFGRFQKMLSDLDCQLTESIPDFHNMEYRLSQLRDAVKEDKAGRVDEVADLLEEIEKRSEWMCEPERMYREGKLPKRVCHCDTKVNNMLFDKNGEVLCVIDLDTVMPSFIFSDYGDFLRTGACTTAEDEPDTEKIDFDMNIFKAFTEGYISEAGSFLTKEEIGWLPDSVALFPYMQAVRFLTDYLNGDSYYKTSYPSHNLVRTRAQFKLLQRIETIMSQLRSFIQSIDYI